MHSRPLRTCHQRNSVSPATSAYCPSSTERTRQSCPVEGATIMTATIMTAPIMTHPQELSLTDAELDEVNGGFLQIIAGAAVGAVLGAGALAVAVAAGDYIRHHTGKDCIFQ